MCVHVCVYASVYKQTSSPDILESVVTEYWSR